ncbi:hypothetical protein BCD67_21485 [Oscillatoriales cyanobacterium USR001]|nr:hypothetical protein BCD67_21485 [Oscillatoriales cyanobacterium USR001]
MTQDKENIEQRVADIEARLDRMNGEFSDRTAILLDGLLALSQQTTAIANRMDQLTDRMDQLTDRMDRLTDRMDRLTDVVARLAQNAEADKVEFRRIWEYLESQQRNQGNGHG